MTDPHFEEISRQDIFNNKSVFCIISKTDTGWYRVLFEYHFSDGSVLDGEDEDVDIDIEDVESLDRAQEMAKFIVAHLKMALSKEIKDQRYQ